MSSLSKISAALAQNDYNALDSLLKHLKPSKASKEGVQLAHSTFTRLSLKGPIAPDAVANTPALQQVQSWMQERWDQYLRALCRLLEHDELHVIALAALVDHLATISNAKQQFDSQLYEIIVGAVLSSNNPAIVAEFSTNWINKFHDLRFHFLKLAYALVNSDKRPQSPANLLTVLSTIAGMPSTDDEILEFHAFQPEMPSLPPPSKKRKTKTAVSDGSTGIFDSSSDEESQDDEDSKINRKKRKQMAVPPVLTVAGHRKAFTQAWTYFLRNYKLEEDQAKTILVGLHRNVLPWFNRPVNLMDWLSDCCDFGGTIALLALNGLFTLITKHNLDYPDFYKQLYALLDRNVLHVRYRSRFMRMLAIFLSSSHLPATLIAAFTKRLSHLSLQASPPAIISIIPFVYNLLKRHPSCMVLIHRFSEDSEFKDPYLPEETDPLKSNALESSIWELADMKNHYLASVSSLAKVLSEQFKRPEFDMEDFLDFSYTTLLDTEYKRVLRNAPALNDETLTALQDLSKQKTGAKLMQQRWFPDSTSKSSTEVTAGEENQDLVAQRFSF